MRRSLRKRREPAIDYLRKAKVIPLLSCVILLGACASQTQRTAGLVVIVAERPSRISEIDGDPSRKRIIERLPGAHSIEFYGEFGDLFKNGPGWDPGFGKPTPLLSTRCFVNLPSMVAGRYSYSTRLTVDRNTKGPDGRTRWTKTSVDPQLLDADGIPLGGMQCENTCALQGKKKNKTVLSASCLERDMSPLDVARSEVDRATGELLGDYLSRLRVECESRGHKGDQDLSECMTSLVQNPIVFRLESGAIHRFVPSSDASISPGLRDEARNACVHHATSSQRAECLGGYGWTPLP